MNVKTIASKFGSYLLGVNPTTAAKKFGSYLLGVLIVIDILCNALFLRGCPWETMSSVAYRKHRDGTRFGFMMHVINTLFFNRNHCFDAYTNDRNRILPK